MNASERSREQSHPGIAGESRPCRVMLMDLAGNLIWTDADGPVESGNGEGAALPANLRDLIVEESGATVEALLADHRENRAPVGRAELGYRHADGACRRASVITFALFSDNGAASGVLLVEKPLAGDIDGNAQPGSKASLEKRGTGIEARDLLVEAIHDLRQPLQALVVLNSTLEMLLRHDDNCGEMVLLQRKALEDLNRIMGALADRVDAENLRR